MGWLKSVRAVATIMIVGSFCYLVVMGKMETAVTIALVTMVLKDYFGKERSKML